LTIARSAIRAAPVADFFTVYCAAYRPVDVRRSTSTVTTSPVPRTSTRSISVVASTIPSSGPGPDAGGASSAAADTLSPRASDARYTRTTLAARRANDDAGAAGAADGDATSGVAVATFATGAEVGGTGVGGGGGGGPWATTFGAGAADGGAAGDGVERAVGRAVGAALGECPGDALASGDGVSDGAADALGDADGVGIGDGEGSGFGERVGRGEGVAGDAVAAVVADAASGLGSGGIVAGGVEALAIGTPSPARLPASESPAPITNPSTMTPIRIGRIGSDEPPLGGWLRRVRRGGEPGIARPTSASRGSGLASRT